jgi:hypothetical protein
VELITNAQGEEKCKGDAGKYVPIHEERRELVRLDLKTHLYL